METVRASRGSQRMNVQNRWDSFKQRRGQSLGSPERGDGEDYDREDGEGEGETDELAERRPLVSEKQSKAEKEKGSEHGRAELRPGGYQVLVCITKAEDLIPHSTRSEWARGSARLGGGAQEQTVHQAPRPKPGPFLQHPTSFSLST